MALLAFVAFVQNAMAADQNAITAKDIEQYSTLHSIGVKWSVVGDDDHDATCGIRYRETGTTQWKNAMDLCRWYWNKENYISGSVFFLRAGTSYDLELTLKDPD